MKARRTIFILAVFTMITAFIGGCHHRGFGSDKTPDRILDRLDDHVEDLKLNAEQNVKYEDLKSRLKVDLSKQQANHKAFKFKIKDLVETQNGDVKDLTAELRSKIKGMPDTAELYLDYVDELYDILDETQKETVMIEIRDKVDSRYFNR